MGIHLPVAIGDDVAKDDTVDRTAGRAVVDSVEEAISTTPTTLMVEYVILVVEVMWLLSGGFLSLKLTILL